MKNHPPLTRARLRELLHYDKATGEFRWLERVGNEVRPGPVAGTVDIRVQGRHYSAHQLAYLYMTGRWGRPMIDHRDGNSTNNRWSNLRLATASQNNANRRLPGHNTSGYKGVVYCHKSRRWRGFIRYRGRVNYLGSFATPEAAHAAYVAAAPKVHGKFARTK